MRLTLLVSLLALSAARAAPITLPNGGQPVTVNTVVIGGVTYVKLDDLRKALAPQGGANQRASLEGCMNEWLFNGLWRLRVTDAKVVPREPGSDKFMYAVTVEVRNGAPATLTPQETGMKDSGAVGLVLKSGDQMSYSWGSDYQQKTYGKFMQGSGYVFTFNYRPDYNRSSQAELTANPPAKFLVDVIPQVSPSVKQRYSVPDPSFRVSLTCKK